MLTDFNTMSDKRVTCFSNMNRRITCVTYGIKCMGEWIHAAEMRYTVIASMYLQPFSIFACSLS